MGLNLYIANTTQQELHFFYRLPEHRDMRNQIVRIGSQTKISGDLTQEDIDYIVEQHAPYGLIDYREIDRTKKFIGMCYSTDKPVPIAKIMVAIEHNNHVLVERGKEIRQQAAIASNNALEQSLMESGRKEIMKGMEFEIIEDNHRDKDTSPAMAEGIRVDRTLDGERARSRGSDKIKRR